MVIIFKKVKNRCCYIEKSIKYLSKVNANLSLNINMARFFQNMNSASLCLCELKSLKITILNQSKNIIQKMKTSFKCFTKNIS